MVEVACFIMDAVANSLMVCPIVEVAIALIRAFGLVLVVVMLMVVLMLVVMLVLLLVRLLLVRTMR